MRGLPSFIEGVFTDCEGFTLIYRGVLISFIDFKRGLPSFIEWSFIDCEGFTLIYRGVFTDCEGITLIYRGGLKHPYSSSIIMF